MLDNFFLTLEFYFQMLKKLMILVFWTSIMYSRICSKKVGLSSRGVPDTRFKVRCRTKTLPDLWLPDRDFYNDISSQYFICPYAFKLSFKFSLLLTLNFKPGVYIIQAGPIIAWILTFTLVNYQIILSFLCV